MSTLHDPWLDRAADRGGRDDETDRPTRVRFVVLASACVLAVITYIHRVGFATAIAEIKGPLGLTDGHLGWLMASFMVAYGLFEMPWGSLGDRLGVRNILAAIILGGSALTAALVLVVWFPQKVVWTFTFLLLVRFLFGAFQAGTFPSISRMMADWMPLQERGGAQGLLWMSSRVGGAAAPSLLVWLIAVIGNWQAPVLLAACLGAVWCCRLLAVVPEPARRYAAGQPGRAQNHRIRSGRQGRFRPRQDSLVGHGPVTERRGPLRDVRVPGLQRQLLLDITAHLSQEPSPPELRDRGPADLDALRLWNGRLPDGRRDV